MSMTRFTSPTAYVTSIVLMVQEHFQTITRDDVTFYSGVVLGVGTFVINWYYKAKDDKRRESGTKLSRSTDV